MGKADAKSSELKASEAIANGTKVYCRWKDTDEECELVAMLADPPHPHIWFVRTLVRPSRNFGEQAE